jgi:ribose transport system substrate-binding protein
LNAFLVFTENFPVETRLTLEIGCHKIDPLSETNCHPVIAVTRAATLLRAFQFDGELLRLRDLTARTGLSKATAFRLMSTLVATGLADRIGDRQYRSAVKIMRQRKYRLGYAGQSAEFAFSRDVTDSMIQASARADVDLVVVDNRYSSKMALRNAQMLIRERVDLIVEFQTDEHIAPELSARYLEAAIPVIAVEIPHPGAVYYGANNYGAGLIGGRYLGKWARQEWQGEIDEVLLLELAMAGPLPRSRLTGMVAGIREVLPGLQDAKIHFLDGNGQFGASLEALRKHLRTSRAQRVLVGAVNDPSALGALRAFEEAGRSTNCAVMGQNASLEARAELRRRGTRLIGSVGYFPELYGDGIVALALDMLCKKPVPPAKFVKHQLITAKNVDCLYPNDCLREAAGT